MVKELTGLPINHVVNVDFLGFVRAVYAIGCVYVDVDRRYFHSNVGVPASEQYAEINVQPGYQLLCGKKALQYVRYRHTDTDLVRSARQQDFISAARQRVSVERPGLRPERPDRHLHQIHDLRHQRQGDDAQVLKLFVASRNADDQRGPLPGRTRAQLRLRRRRKRSTKRSNKFLGDRSQRRPARVARRRRRSEDRTKKARRQAARRARSKKHEEAEAPKPKPPGSDGLVPAARSRRSRGRRSRPQASARLPGLLPDPAARPAPTSSKATPTNTSGPARLPLQRHRRRTPRRLPDGGRSASSPTASTTSACRGSSGWADPPILNNPSRDQDDQRPRIRHLRRRRPGQADRLAPRRQHLLGLQRPAADA